MKKDVISDREYRSAERGESWKFQLMSAITEVMKQAKSQKQFVFMMRQLGYGVRWEDSRKYITYTCPNGRKCRCAKLHEERYSKEMMEHEFKIRCQCLDGTKQIAVTDSLRNHADGSGAGEKLVSGNQFVADIVRGASGVVAIAGDSYDGITDAMLSGESAGAVQSSGGKVFGDTENNGRTDSKGAAIVDQTDWEAERGIFLAAEKLRRIEAKNTVENAQSGCDFADSAVAFIDGIGAISSLIDEQTEDEDIDRHTDSKILAKEIKRKEELGMRM